MRVRLLSGSKAGSGITPQPDVARPYDFLSWHGDVTAARNGERHHGAAVPEIDRRRVLSAPPSDQAVDRKDDQEVDHRQGDREHDQRVGYVYPQTGRFPGALPARG